MIIDCISDLHGHYPKLEGGDLLIVAGDLTARDNEDEYTKVFDWMYSYLKYKKIIFIAGNHDNLVKQDTNFFRRSNANLINESLDKSHIKKVEYLCDSGTKFEGLKIWGSPWSLWFDGINPHCCAFTGSEEDLAKKYDLIPEDTDILITHGPPFGILDEIYYEESSSDACHSPIFSKNVGSISLLNSLYKIRPRLCVFGHIHEGYGKKYTDTICVNSSHVNELYQPVNKPVRIVL